MRAGGDRGRRALAARAATKASAPVFVRHININIYIYIYVGYIYTHIYAHNYNIICFVCLPICACTRVCARTPATKKTGLRRAGSCQCYSGSEPNGSGVHFRQTYIRIFFFKKNRNEQKSPAICDSNDMWGSPPDRFKSIYIYIYLYFFSRSVSAHATHRCATCPRASRALTEPCGDLFLSSS